MPQTTKATAKARPNSLSLSSFLGDEPTTYEVPRGGKSRKKRIRISEVEAREVAKAEESSVGDLVTYGTITQCYENARSSLIMSVCIFRWSGSPLSACLLS